MPRVSQSVLLGAIAVFLAPPVNGFGGLNYLRSSSTNSRPITVPKGGGPSYLFMPVGAIPRLITGVFFVCLWVIYVTVSGLKATGKIDFSM